jgi:hypothetical protein
VASFEESPSSFKESAGVLGALGPFGWGVEYAQFGSAPYASGTGAINWGLASTLDAAALRVGVSGHHLKGSGGDYDLGVLFDPARQFRFGVLLPSVQNGLRDLGAGLTLGLDPTFDLVVDAAMDLRSRDGIVKPGLNLHADRFVVSGGYGFRVHGTTNPILNPKLSVGIGVRFSDHILIEYSYRALPEHLLGLTLR